MRNRLGIATALAVVLGLGAASAVRAALDEATQKSFDSADVDGDSKVSWEEYRNRMLHVFHAMDHNGDGRLTPDETPPAKDKSGQPVKGGTTGVRAVAARRLPGGHRPAMPENRTQPGFRIMADS